MQLTKVLRALRIAAHAATQTLSRRFLAPGEALAVLCLLTLPAWPQPPPPGCINTGVPTTLPTTGDFYLNFASTQSQLSNYGIQLKPGSGNAAQGDENSIYSSFYYSITNAEALMTASGYCPFELVVVGKFPDISQTVGGAGEYQNQPNWCGHGSGIWMSGRGPAASNGELADGYIHIYMGSGNGGFQPNGQNWGESIIDFRNGSTVETTPFQSFTPYGGAKTQPPLSVTTCSGGGDCGYTFEALNENDWDMGVSGILAFEDPSGNPWLVTTDKAGFGYLFQQGNLCGATETSGLTQCDSAGVVQSFASGDPGDKFPFQAARVTCIGSGTGPQTTDCDRVTSMAFYSNGTNSYLYMWATNTTSGNDERLTALQLSNNSAITPTGSPTITTDSTGTIVYGSTSFTTLLIPGDQITADSQTVWVTAVDNTQLTVSPAFSSPITSGVSYTYNGYFVNPARDFTPPPLTTGYPGGALALTSSSGSDAVIWSVIAANQSASGQTSSTVVRTPGALYAYGATPVTSPSLGLQRLWDSAEYCTNCQTFCVSSAALPTVANGLVFVPTYSINQTSDTTQLCPTDTTQDSTSWQTGILAYGH